MLCWWLVAGGCVVGWCSGRPWPGTRWAGYGINRGLGIERPPLAVGVLIAVAAVAVTWFVNFALIRAVAIKRVSG